MALTGGIAPLGPVPLRISFDFFFDRPKVQDALDKATHRGLYKSGSVIMQIARRSIKKMGMAKPKLAVQKKFEGAALRDLLRFSDTMVSKAAKNKIRDRIFEIKYRPPSQAGTPPHTHLGTLRNSIVFAYDPSSQSVVVGGFMEGIPRIVSLHEFGGIQTMQAWAWIPDNKGKGYSGIIGWWTIGRKPQLQPGRWQQMGAQWRETFNYPARPYMRPAMFEAIRRNDIVRQFADRMRMGG
jgi:hypothetical protein